MFQYIFEIYHKRKYTYGIDIIRRLVETVTYAFNILTINKDKKNLYFSTLPLAIPNQLIFTLAYS